MAIDNAVVWVFSPDLEQSQIEWSDYGHTQRDNLPTMPNGTRFDPADASMGEMRRAAGDYWDLAPNEVNRLNFDPADEIAVLPEYAHICDTIYIVIHRDYDGTDEVNLPARAQQRLAALRAGDPMGFF